MVQAKRPNSPLQPTSASTSSQRASSTLLTRTISTQPRPRFNLASPPVSTWTATTPSLRSTTFVTCVVYFEHFVELPHSPPVARLLSRGPLHCMSYVSSTGSNRNPTIIHSFQRIPNNTHIDRTFSSNSQPPVTTSPRPADARRQRPTSPCGLNQPLLWLRLLECPPQRSTLDALPLLLLLLHGTSTAVSMPSSVGC